MADNLQDFLRKAAEKRRQESGEPTPIESVRAEPPTVQPLTRQPQPEPLIEIVEAQPVQPVPIETVTENISNHVRQHMEPHVHAERVERMGDNIESSSIDPHLHEVFDHSVGHLSRSSVSDSIYENDGSDKAYQVSEIDYFDEAAAKQTRPNFISSLMNSPQNIMQAFIFSEIIKRPTDRWED